MLENYAFLNRNKYFSISVFVLWNKLFLRYREYKFRNWFYHWSIKMGLKKSVATVINQGIISSKASENKAIVKLPAYVKTHLEKVKVRELKQKFDVMRKVRRKGDTSCPIISCNKKEYNFYRGQLYSKQYPTPIMSRYWMKMNSAGEKFTINPWSSNPSLPTKLEIPAGITKKENDLQSMSYFISEFSQLNLAEPVLKAIASMDFQQPTPIQAMTIPKLMDKKNVICVAETGGGKTMTYLIPIIHNLLLNKDKQERFPDTPLALVVTPGRELAEQIAKVAYNFGGPCGVSVKLLIPEGTEARPLVPKPGEKVDLLVASFGTIKKLASRGIFKLSHLQHLVLDEADTLLDDSFEEDIRHFLTRLHVRNSLSINNEGAQLILVSTTMPMSFAPIGGLEENEFVKSVSPHIHRILPHVPQKFIRVNLESKAGVFLELIKNDFKKKIPVMIFSNSSLTCNWISNFLNGNSVHHVKFHSDMQFCDRMDSFNRFQFGDVDVLCCTDLASRGLDTQRTKHVINFDFPNSMSDYILRVGRVGRVGTNHGHVTSLIVKKSGVYVLQDIEMAVRNSTELKNVDANITKKLHTLFGKLNVRTVPESDDEEEK